MYTCIIYKIHNSDDDKIYIGSTKQLLRRRFSGHKMSARGNISNQKIHIHMRKLGIDKFNIEELYSAEVSNKSGQMILELEWQKKLLPKLNTNRAYLSYNNMLKLEKIYRTKHHDKIKKQRDKHREEHKDYFKEYQKNYYSGWKEKNKEKFDTYQREYTIRRKDTKKEYDIIHRENNKEKHAERKKKWRENNISTGRYKCPNCDKCLGSSNELNIHTVIC